MKPPANADAILVIRVSNANQSSITACWMVITPVALRSKVIAKLKMAVASV